MREAGEVARCVFLLLDDLGVKALQPRVAHHFRVISDKHLLPQRSISMESSFLSILFIS